MARVSSASNSARLSAAESAEVGASWADYASPSAISIEDEEEDDELGT